MATFYLDFENGNDSNDGLSFANRWKTITNGATAARTAPGDIIRIMKSPDPVSLGVNGTFTKQSPTITLASAVTQNISTCETAWTAAANVTTTTSSTRKEGTLSASATVAVAWTPGLISYQATGTLDLSAYQNVSFWIRSSNGLTANALRLDLCSDTAGTTPVHSITIDTAFAAGIWKPVTWKNGSALSSSIKSVALYGLNDPGANTVFIDNIIATNDLHFNSLIGTSSSATNQVWYPIRSINGTTIIMGNEQNQDATGGHRGWHDTTITTLAYVRDTIRLTTAQTVNEGGIVTNKIIYSGGWDRTDMSTQNGITFTLSDGNITSSATITHTGGDVIFDRISFVYGTRAFAGLRTGDRVINGGVYASNSQQASNSDVYFESFYYMSNSVSLNNAQRVYFNGLYVYSNSGGLTVSNAGQYVNNGIIRNNLGAGITVSTVLYASNLEIYDNGSSAVSVSGYFKCNYLTSSGHTYTISDAGGITDCHYINSLDTYIYDGTSILSRLNTSRYVGTIAQSIGKIFYNLSESSNEISVRALYNPIHGVSSISWAHNPSIRHWSNMPMIQPFQPFAVGTSTLVTFKIWVYRTSTNVEGRVRLRGYVTPGVDADVTATITAPINTWQQLTVTCTPTAAGVVQIDLESYSVNGSTGTVYFGDASITQA